MLKRPCNFASFCVFFSVDSVVINVKLIENKLLSKREEVMSAQAKPAVFVPQ